MSGEGESTTRVDEGLELTPWGTRFVCAATERRYRAWHIEHSIPFNRAGMAASFVVWVAALVLFWVFGILLSWIPLAVIVVLPSLLFAILTTYRRSLLRWILPSAMAANLIAGVVVVGIGNGGHAGLEAAIGGVFLANFIGFAIVRVRPAQAAFTITPYVALEILAMARDWQRGQFTGTSFPLDLFLMTSGFFTGLTINVVFDIVSRRTYRQERIIERQGQRLAEEHEMLGRERAKSEALLRNVLPTAIAERLKADPSHIADGFSEVTILFADIVGFTDLAARLSPAAVVAMLNHLFTAFDDLAEMHGLEKIKTIGDAYMVVGGLPEPRNDHAAAVVAMAVDMRNAVAEVAKETGHELGVRIGVNTGAVIAGVIGKKKFAYDLWGDAVNTASRMESHGIAGEIQVSESTYESVRDAFEMQPRGIITVKGKGELRAWFVRGRTGVN